MKRTLVVLFVLFGSLIHSSMTFAKEEGISASGGESNVKKNIVLFSGNANRKLAEEVAQQLGIGLGKAKVNRFSDGEIQILIEQNIRNKEVYILQSTSFSSNQSVNDNLMELYLLVRAAKRASAGNITAIIPYYGYARQDRKINPREPISASDIALLLETSGVDRVVAIDLHCGQIQGFFRNIPVDNLYASAIFVPYFQQKNLQNIVVVSPDAGGVERAKRFSESLKKKGLQTSMAVINKQRLRAEVIESMTLVGDVEGADAIIIDDMSNTGGTLVHAAQLLKEKGARRVFAAVTHPVFVESAWDRIHQSVIDELLVSDTVALSREAPPNMKCISVAPLLAETIRRISLGDSVSDLFP